MIEDADGKPRYYDKEFDSKARTISPELRRLFIEMEQNPRFSVAREFNFYPRGFPTHSPGWGIGC